MLCNYYPCCKYICCRGGWKKGLSNSIVFLGQALFLLLEVMSKQSKNLSVNITSKILVTDSRNPNVIISQR